MEVLQARTKGRRILDCCLNLERPAVCLVWCALRMEENTVDLHLDRARNPDCPVEAWPPCRRLKATWNSVVSLCWSAERQQGLGVLSLF